MDKRIDIDVLERIIQITRGRIVQEFLKTENMESHLLNHVWRIFLQTEDKEMVKEVVIRTVGRQLQDGGWGYAQSTQSVLGITATIIQLLFWSKSVLCNTGSMCASIDVCIHKAMKYLMNNNDNNVFWTEKDETVLKRKHGLIDINHYIAQDLFYYYKEKEATDVMKRYYSLCNWYVSLQCIDGGWHEVDKIRSRIGTTADAVRALLPNTTYKAFIEKGTDFLVNNQNTYMGYWANGNLDKCFDSMKTVLATAAIFKMGDKYYEYICLGTNYLLTLDIDLFNFEEICDLLSVFIDVSMFLKNKNSHKDFF